MDPYPSISVTLDRRTIHNEIHRIADIAQASLCVLNMANDPHLVPKAYAAFADYLVGITGDHVTRPAIRGILDNQLPMDYVRAEDADAITAVAETHFDRAAQHVIPCLNAVLDEMSVQLLEVENMSFYDGNDPYVILLLVDLGPFSEAQTQNIPEVCCDRAGDCNCLAMG